MVEVTRGIVQILFYPPTTTLHCAYTVTLAAGSTVFLGWVDTSSGVYAIIALYAVYTITALYTIALKLYTVCS